MAIVSAVMMGLTLFTDVGLKANVVQSPRGDDPDYLNTAWTLQIIHGCALFLLASMLAWPVAKLYSANDPASFELAYLLPITALATLVASFQSAKMMTAARHLRVKDVVKMELIVGAFNFLVVLLLAYFMRSVYALVIASVLGHVLYTTLSYVMLDGPKSRFRIDSSAVKSIVSFGKWVFLSSFTTFLALQIDRLMFAGMYPLATVGVYSIAAGLALMIPSLMGAIQNSIAFPLYSRLKERGVELSEAYRITRMPLLLGVTLLAALLIAGADSFFELAYDARYSDGALYLPILAVSVWFSSVNGMYGAMFLAIGKPQWSALINATRVAFFVVTLFALSWAYESMLISVLAVPLSDLMALVFSKYFGRKIGLSNVRAEMAMFMLLLFAAGTGWWLANSVQVISSLHPLMRLLLVGCFEAAIFIPLSWKTIASFIAARAK